MNDFIPETEEQFEEWQANRTLNRTAELRTELIIADQKLQALRAFTAEARSHEGPAGAFEPKGSLLPEIHIWKEFQQPKF